MKIEVLPTGQKPEIAIMVSDPYDIRQLWEHFKTPTTCMVYLRDEGCEYVKALIISPVPEKK